MAESKDDGDTSAAFTSPLMSFKFSGKKTAEFIATLCLTLLATCMYLLWEHKEDSKELSRVFANGVSSLTKGQDEQNRIARQQLCLMSLPEEKREREFLSENSFCSRISRER